jgi:hypothetical protein
MDEKTYQQNELKRFYAQVNGYHENAKDFSEWIENSNILEQIEWIENGSYGAGSCLAMQQVLKRITPRMNATAHIGQIVLRCFHGAPFKNWKGLSKKAQDKMTKSVDKWMKRKHNFAMTLIG